MLTLLSVMFLSGWRHPAPSFFRNPQGQWRRIWRRLWPWRSSYSVAHWPPALRPQGKVSRTSFKMQTCTRETGNVSTVVGFFRSECCLWAYQSDSNICSPFTTVTTTPHPSLRPCCQTGWKYTAWPQPTWNHFSRSFSWDLPWFFLTTPTSLKLDPSLHSFPISIKAVWHFNLFYSRSCTIPPNQVPTSLENVLELCTWLLVYWYFSYTPKSLACCIFSNRCIKIGVCFQTFVSCSHIHKFYSCELPTPPRPKIEA